jgi:hypothetical protein
VDGAGRVAGGVIRVKFARQPKEIILYMTDEIVIMANTDPTSCGQSSGIEGS